MNRYAQCAVKAKADIVVRVTADNPLTSAELIDYVVEYLQTNKCDYVFPKDIPYGAGSEAITIKALLKSNEMYRDMPGRITNIIRNSPNLFSVDMPACPLKGIRRPDVRVTVDTLDDYKVMARYFQINYGQANNLRTFIKLFDENRLS